MRRLGSFIFALLLATPLAFAQEVPRPVAQIPLLRLADGEQRDITDLVMALWQPYYNTNAEHAFGRDNLRAGRFDLDGDGQAELILMIDAEGWEADPGDPFVIARWTQGHWIPVGWGWGDQDSVFAAEEIQGGWRTVVTNSEILRWTGREYQITERELPPAPWQ